MEIRSRDSKIYEQRQMCGRTLGDIAEEYQLSVERVRQICERIDHRQQWGGLSTRAQNMLKNIGYVSLQEFKEKYDFSRQNFPKVRNAGPTTHRELEALRAELRRDRMADGALL
jgi:hypothetical protein